MCIVELPSREGPPGDVYPGTPSSTRPNSSSRQSEPMSEPTVLFLCVHNAGRPVDGPAGKGIEAVRPIRDEIEQRVRTLLASLGTAR